MSAIAWVRSKATVTTEIVVITAEEAALTEGTLVGTFERREFRWAGRLPYRMCKEISLAKAKGELDNSEEARDFIVNPYGNRPTETFREYMRVEYHRVAA